MDVIRFGRRAGALLGLFIFVTACNQNKTSQSVFPAAEKNGSNLECLNEQASRISNRFMVSWEDGSFSVEKAENSEVFIQNFLEPRLQDIRHVEFDRLVRVNQNVAQEPTVHIQAADPVWGQRIVHLDSVLSQGIKGQGVTVAIIDTPVDHSHPQLQARMVAGWDFVSNSLKAPVPHDHATHIAGVIAASEGGSMVGMAPQAQLMSVSFMTPKGEGSLSDSIKALNFAADKGAQIINNSWGGPACSKTLRTTMKSLSDRGVLLIVAAGNDSADISNTPSFPASFTNPLQITVGASQASDIMSAFSNTGWNLVHIAAPGQDIYSTVPGGYGVMSGTSMASPFVSGAAALLMSAKPLASPMQIKQALLNSIDPGPFRVSTQGRLNVQRALDEIRRLVP